MSIFKTLLLQPFSKPFKGSIPINELKYKLTISYAHGGDAYSLDINDDEYLQKLLTDLSDAFINRKRIILDGVMGIDMGNVTSYSLLRDKRPM